MCPVATSLLWTRKMASQAKNTMPCAVASVESGARRPAGCTIEGANPAVAVASIANAQPVKKPRTNATRFFTFNETRRDAIALPDDCPLLLGSMEADY